MASSPTTPIPSAPGSTATSRSNTPSLSMPDAAAVPSNTGADTASKIRTLLGILRKFIGTDLTKIRFSLPATILTPAGNLDWWNYNSRPDSLLAMGGSDHDVGRMFEALRFWCTKDISFLRSGVQKPLNSCLGEMFRCNYDIGRCAPQFDSIGHDTAQPPTNPLQTDNSTEPIRLSYLTEQTSHHPPVSAYWAECPAKGLVLRGYDEITAKFSGTTVRIMAGSHNKGIYITLKKRDDEEYHMTHPDIQINGLIKASPYISVADVCYIRCEKTKLKIILHYIEEGYFGKAQNKVVGVMYRYDPENDKYTKPRDVPEKDILAKIEGDWKDKVYYTVPSNEAVKKEPNLEPTKDKQLLIDVAPLMPVPKIVPPPEEQLDNESRKQWSTVTEAIMEKRFNDATNLKQDIEQRQRDKATAREKLKKPFVPRFFTAITDEGGRPELTEEGRKALDGMQQLNFHLEPRLEEGIDV